MPASARVNVARTLASRETRAHSEPPRVFEDACARSPRALQTLCNVGTLKGHQGCVNTISFSASGHLLASGSDDRTVKIWDVGVGTSPCLVDANPCLATIPGHCSNVFAATFVPNKGDKEIVSAGNDADIRHVDLISRTCTVYRVHTRKVLRITHNPHMTDTFLTCSADGTVRMIDLRVKYAHRRASTIDDGQTDDEDRVLPQAFGGGRATRDDEPLVQAQDTLVLRYRPSESTGEPVTLFSVDFHPLDGRTFVVSGSDGAVRLFDLRYIRDFSPASYINIYRNAATRPNTFEATGCVFNRTGTEIAATFLNDSIYTFDTQRNFEREGVDFFAIPGRRPKRPRETGTTPPAAAAAPSAAPSAAAAAAAPAPAESYTCSTCGLRDYPGIRYRCLECEGFEQCHKCRIEDRVCGSHRVGHGASIIAPQAPAAPGPAPRRRRPHAALEVDFEALLGGQLRFRRVDVDELGEALGGEQAEAGQEEGREEAEAEAAENEGEGEAEMYNPEEPDEEDEEEEAQPQAPPCTYKQVYRGHVSSDTIKACNFYGPDSEYVVSGSDDANVYIWEKKSGELVRMLAGHTSVVNCVVQHPHGTMLATSGIDNETLLWDCRGDYPSSSRLAKRQAEMQRRAGRNMDRMGRGVPVVDRFPACQTQ
eukprot:m51a1_g10633 hypothetical protein (651) ;mRNA; f:67465-70698